MTDISVKGLFKSYEIGNTILNGLSFEVSSGEHIGILGANGCGKTTLFKILVGEIDFDEGCISIANGKRIGLISQIPNYPIDYTAEDVLMTAHKRLYTIQERLNEIAKIMEHDASDSLLNEFDRLSDEFSRSGGYDMDYERDRVANGLDISTEMRTQRFVNLSGGEKTRVNLARLILEDTDILLLDEPTNHLDLKATEWLEDYIIHFHGTVLAISHDRYFLDTVCKRCISISNGKAEFYSGNYSFYVVESQKRFEEKLKKYEKDQAKIEQLQKASEQMHIWAFMGNDKLHKRAFSMEKRIEKLKLTDKPTTAKNLSVKIKESDFYGDEAIIINGVSKSYNNKNLFTELNLTVSGQERIAIIGDNGSGKSTLIKIIMGKETPDYGFIHLGPTIKPAYLPQIVEFSDMSRSCLDTMLYDCKCQPQDARNRLASFGFRGEDVLKPVAALSGGERSRLMLCMVMGSDINLLVLDEPTNHLDIASREWMEDAIANYNQSLIFVSHDRYFIDKFATRIWSFTDGEVIDYKGSFTQYKEYMSRQQVYSQNERKAEKKQLPKNHPSNKQKQLLKIEKEINIIEKKILEIDLLIEQYSSDYQKLMDLDNERTALDVNLNKLYTQWEQISE